MMVVVVAQYGFSSNLFHNIHVEAFDTLYTVALWIFLRTAPSRVLLFKIIFYLTKSLRVKRNKLSVISKLPHFLTLFRSFTYESLEYSPGIYFKSVEQDFLPLSS